VLYAASYSAVGIAIVGCFVYLFVTRDREGGAWQQLRSMPGMRPAATTRAKRPQKVSEETSRALAAELDGERPLSDLGLLLASLGSGEAWGMILSLDFKRQGKPDWAQMNFGEGQVDLYDNNGGTVEGYSEKFRLAAVSQGLEVEVASKDVAFIAVKGT